MRVKFQVWSDSQQRWRTAYAAADMFGAIVIPAGMIWALIGVTQLLDGPIAETAKLFSTEYECHEALSQARNHKYAPDELRPTYFCVPAFPGQPQ